jgi:hypothetical protein
MSYEEFRDWQLYADEFPFGYREDQRAAMITSAAASIGGNKVDMNKLFPTLQHMEARRKSHFQGTLRNSAMFKFMMSSVGGKHLDIN